MDKPTVYGTVIKRSNRFEGTKIHCGVVQWSRHRILVPGMGVRFSPPQQIIYQKYIYKQDELFSLHRRGVLHYDVHTSQQLLP